MRGASDFSYIIDTWSRQFLVLTISGDFDFRIIDAIKPVVLSDSFCLAR
jgi:hypothetical protein